MARRLQNSFRISCPCCARQFFVSRALPSPAAKSGPVTRMAIRTGNSFIGSSLLSLSQLRRCSFDLLPRFRPAPEMLGEELFDPAIEIHLVLRSREAVAFVGINHISHFAFCIA